MSRPAAALAAALAGLMLATGAASASEGARTTKKGGGPARPTSEATSGTAGTATEQPARTVTKTATAPAQTQSVTRSATATASVTTTKNANPGAGAAAAAGAAPPEKPEGEEGGLPGWAWGLIGAAAAAIVAWAIVAHRGRARPQDGPGGPPG